LKSIFWHRRDLCLDDNAALYLALKESLEVQPIFIFDSSILENLPQVDKRVLFIYQEIEKLKKKYQELGSDLLVYYGNPTELICKICIDLGAQALFANRDYEPYALRRDKTVYLQLQEHNISFKAQKNHVIFEKGEILKGDGTPYTIFTPYSRKWKEKLTDFYLKPYANDQYFDFLVKNEKKTPLLSLESMGFKKDENYLFPSEKIAVKKIQNYHETRDIPALDATSRLSLHLRFGTVSIRKLATIALLQNEKYLNELIWRDFYQMIIYHFPHSVENCFKKKYDRVEWEFNETHFQTWCKGETGYPMVDAGMRELNETGFMHNRVRMVVASFLCKHLLIDWRLGERYFAEKLLDFELASNVGGWQWAAGSGCDAAPYFRVFNPQLQQEKFDKEFIYIKKWIPEFGTSAYPKPIVEHAFARDRAIQRYKQALNNN
jgi:deoxyribodipyrimidine photo-lyase